MRHTYFPELSSCARILLGDSSNTTIVGNNMTNNMYGIWLAGSSNNTVTGNNITANNSNGISFSGSSHNTVAGNNMTSNYLGIKLLISGENMFFHNNLINNTKQVTFDGDTGQNTWDNGCEATTGATTMVQT